VAAAAVVVVVRYWRFQHRWFVLTGAVLLQVTLHGLMGLSYLVAATISLVLAAIAIAVSYFMGSTPEERRSS